MQLHLKDLWDEMFTCMAKRIRPDYHWSHMILTPLPPPEGMAAVRFLWSSEQKQRSCNVNVVKVTPSEPLLKHLNNEALPNGHC